MDRERGRIHLGEQRTCMPRSRQISWASIAQALLGALVEQRYSMRNRARRLGIDNLCCPPSPERGVEDNALPMHLCSLNRAVFQHGHSHELPMWHTHGIRIRRSLLRSIRTTSVSTKEEAERRSYCYNSIRKLLFRTHRRLSCGVIGTESCILVQFPERGFRIEL